MIGISKVGVRVFQNEENRESDDLLVREEPLEIRLGLGPLDAREQYSLSVTMRTPGNDDELAMGFLYSESIISSVRDINGVHYCTDIKKPEEEGNVLRVELRPDIRVDLEKLNRHFYTTSSCGVCGKSSLEAVEQEAKHKIIPFELEPDLVLELPHILREKQTLFKATGGIHAAGLFQKDGALIHLMEDIGRHNAVDKLVGYSLLQEKIPWSENILVVSGRGGFELVQKAVLAGVSAFVSVGAPSNLSVELARKHGLKLYGFIKKDGFNIYS